VVLSTGDVNPSSAKFMPDGRTICLTGMEPGRRSRLYLYDLESGKTRPISDEGVGRALDTGSPDGSRILATSPSGPWSIYPIDGGERTTLEFLGPSERPTLWTPDGKSIWTFDRGMIPCPVSRIELATGRREPWMEISPPSRGGVTHINSVCLTPDGGTYAASYVQGLHELYMASGLG
jgi:dipeptidyl aminopeptidase/acylaminoacyl peptidase